MSTLVRHLIWQIKAALLQHWEVMVGFKPKYHSITDNEVKFPCYGALFANSS